MPIEFKDFLASGATSRRFGQQLREEVVSGRATGLSTTAGTTKESAMKFVTDALIAAGRGPGSTHPGDSGQKLLEITLSGLTGDAIDYRLRYSTFQGGVPSVLVIGIEFGERAVTRSYYPGTMQPIYIGWKGKRGTESPDAADAPGLKVNAAIAAQVVAFSYTQTVARLTGTRVLYGSPTALSVVNSGRAKMKVNDSPFLGLAAGKWKQTRYAQVANVYGGTATLSMAAATIGEVDDREDWRVVQILRDGRSGRSARVDAAKFERAIELPYKFGQMGGRGPGFVFDPAVDGFNMFGPFRTARFQDIWGDLSGLGDDSQQQFSGLPPITVDPITNF